MKSFVFYVYLLIWSFSWKEVGSVLDCVMSTECLKNSRIINRLSETQRRIRVLPSMRGVYFVGGPFNPVPLNETMFSKDWQKVLNVTNKILEPVTKRVIGQFIHPIANTTIQHSKNRTEAIQKFTKEYFSNLEIPEKYDFPYEKSVPVY